MRTTQRERCVGDGQLLYTVPQNKRIENAGVQKLKGGKVSEVKTETK